MLKQPSLLLVLFISFLFIQSRPISTKEDIYIFDVIYVEQVFNCLLESEKFLEQYVISQKPERMIDLFIQLVIEGDEVATKCFLEYPPPSNYTIN